MNIVKKIISVAIVIIITVIILILCLDSKENKSVKVNLSNLKYENDAKLKVYTIDKFNEFLNDYNSKKLDDIYVTEFLFDGVSMYKPYDLDDFIKEGNDLEVEPLKITTLNINTTKDIELSGNLNGMIAINTNNIKGNINLILNNVNINTNSKKVPAIYVYNKDITYADSKVTIKTLSNTKNYIEGGKLKKVSLMPSDKLDNYSLNNDYSNYYGIYSSDELNNILFASIKADNEEILDGDPYYFYKATGAISSDIDLYFEGSGYLEVTSKNKEGIETKGNLTFSGGVGDYVINAQNDCLNTTTSDKEIEGARNTLTIDVGSMYAIVSTDAEEGDAIDSNGSIIINDGLIIALSKQGNDSGLDSDKGIYINGGTIISTGDMYNEINLESKQNFMLLSFDENVKENDLITLIDQSDKVIFSYLSDRDYKNLVYSSPKLINGIYYLYKNGTIIGKDKKGYYLDITSYNKGIILGYSVKEEMIEFKDNNQEEPSPNDEKIPPKDELHPQPNNKKTEFGMQNNKNVFKNPSNKEFVINTIASIFRGIGKLLE